MGQKHQKSSEFRKPHSLRCILTRYDGAICFKMAKLFRIIGTAPILDYVSWLNRISKPAFGQSPKLTRHLHYNAYYWISNICHEGRSSKTKLKKVVQKWWVFSIYCLVQTFPCDSKPCLNGAICANDVKDIAKYHCKCTSDYSGVNCQGKLRNTHVLFLLKQSYTSKMIFFL